jgi:hypothetical protein
VISDGSQHGVLACRQAARQSQTTPSSPTLPASTALARSSADLLRNGRARPRRLSDTAPGAGEFIRLERRAAHGATYWIRRDGSEIRASINFATAEALHPGFLEVMERAGALPQES